MPQIEREYLECVYCGDYHELMLITVDITRSKVVCNNCANTEILRIVKELGYTTNGWHKLEGGKIHYFSINNYSLCGNSYWYDEYYSEPPEPEPDSTPDENYCTTCMNRL